MEWDREECIGIGICTFTIYTVADVAAGSYQTTIIQTSNHTQILDDHRGVICTRSQIIATHNHVSYLNIIHTHGGRCCTRTRGASKREELQTQGTMTPLHAAADCFTTSRSYITFTDELHGPRKTIYDFVKNKVYTDTCARSLSSSL